MLNLARLFLWLPLITHGQLNTVIEEWKNDKDLKSASIGFCVLDARTGTVVSEYNSNVSLVPASTLKIITTAAALGILGPGYRYETKISYTGSLNSQTGVLNGDLVVTGSGDPALQSEYFSNSTQPVTDAWAKLLKEKGIREITGKLLGDASFFEPAIPPSWIWADISNYFGTTPCGLSFMDNKFTITYASKDPLSKAIITGTYPNYFQTTYTLNSNVTAKGSEDEAYVYGDPFSYKKEILGTIPPGKPAFEVEAALPDPALMCMETFYTSLRNAGIRCNKNLIVSAYKKQDTLLTRQLLYSHHSPTLDKLVYHTNLKSNNLYCESITRTVGRGDLQQGLEQIKRYWSARGLNPGELYQVDGSGLSRENTITTAFQAKALCRIYQDSLLYPIINASLPVAGKPGSLARIGKGKAIENNLRAKTGYIKRARSYCGYVTLRSGKELAFAVILNNYNCLPGEARQKIEKFLVALGEL